MRYALILFVFCIFYSCRKEDDSVPPAPEGAVLVFPEINSECTTGVDIDEFQSQITFEWQAATNTNRYTLTVINLETNTPQTISTVNTQASLSLAKGAPFSWSVLSSNSESDETATSESWLFYNAGSQRTYAPFPAQIILPQAGSTIQSTTTNQTVLSWSGADVENDIETYQIFFSTTSPPESLFAVTTAENQEVTVSVTAGNTYFWRVVTIDAEGNSSDSGIFDFRVL